MKHLISQLTEYVESRDFESIEVPKEPFLFLLSETFSSLVLCCFRRWRGCEIATRSITALYLESRKGEKLQAAEEGTTEGKGTVGQSNLNLDQ